MVKIDYEKNLNPNVIMFSDYNIVYRKERESINPTPLKICEIDFKPKYYFSNFIELKISDVPEYDDREIIPLNSKCLKVYKGAVKDPSSLEQVLIKC